MMSPDLVRWSSSVSSRLGGTVGRNQEHRKAWEELIRAGEDGLVLDALQNDTPALIAFVRAYQDVRREVWEERVAEQFAEAVPPDMQPDPELGF